MSLTLSFRGLCAFIQRGTTVQVLLNPTCGHHKATLTTLTKFLDTKAPNFWHPDFVGYVPEVTKDGGLERTTQIAVWNITGLRLSVPSEAKTNRPSPNGRLDHGMARAIDLAPPHKGARTWVPTSFGILELGAAAFSLKEPKHFDVVNGKKRKIPCPKDGFATEIRCAELPTTMCGPGGTIHFKNGASAVIANVATEADESRALHHFSHYYDTITDAYGKAIDQNERYSVTRSGQDHTRKKDQDDQPRAQTDEVYDCVPPAATP